MTTFDFILSHLRERVEQLLGEGPSGPGGGLTERYTTEGLAAQVGSRR
jgi:hypothetical protein